MNYCFFLRYCLAAFSPHSSSLCIFYGTGGLLIFKMPRKKALHTVPFDPALSVVHEGLSTDSIFFDLKQKRFITASIVKTIMEMADSSTGEQVKNILNEGHSGVLNILLAAVATGKLTLTRDQRQLVEDLNREREPYDVADGYGFRGALLGYKHGRFNYPNNKPPESQSRDPRKMYDNHFKAKLRVPVFVCFHILSLEVPGLHHYYQENACVEVKAKTFVPIKDVVRIAGIQSFQVNNVNVVTLAKFVENNYAFMDYARYRKSSPLIYLFRPQFPIFLIVIHLLYPQSTLMSTDQSKPPTMSMGEKVVAEVDSPAPPTVQMD